MNWITNYVRPKINSLLQRKEMPENLWVKCPETGEMVFHKDLEANMGVIPNSGYHMRITAKERLGYFFDNGEYALVDPPKVATDPLRFRDKSRYADKLKEHRRNTDDGRFGARRARQVRRHRHGRHRPRHALHRRLARHGRW